MASCSASSRAYWVCRESRLPVIRSTLSSISLGSGPCAATWWRKGVYVSRSVVRVLLGNERVGVYLQVQQPVLHQDLPPLLLQQGFSIRVLRQRLHQVVFGQTEQVRVPDAPDVRRPPVSGLTACWRRGQLFMTLRTSEASFINGPLYEDTTVNKPCKTLGKKQEVWDQLDMSNRSYCVQIQGQGLSKDPAYPVYVSQTLGRP